MGMAIDNHLREGLPFRDFKNLSGFFECSSLYCKVGMGCNPPRHPRRTMGTAKKKNIWGLLEKAHFPFSDSNHFGRFFGEVNDAGVFSHDHPSVDHKI